MTLPLPGFELERWTRVHKKDARARELADRHYSRQTVGAEDFMPPGRVLVLVTPCGRATWGAVENLDPVGAVRWRVTIFRNEGAGLSSTLIVEATDRTRAWWRRHYGAIPAAPLRTEIDPARVRSSNPGFCFLCAGWTRVGVTDGARKGRADLVVLEAPAEVSS